ncbi:MAG TPA: ATP-binding protein [Actinomycetota bacterium]|nr:ATP-binding protein [Actinomycetota bacterium]
MHRGSADDAGFRLLAEHLPDIIILAFDDRLDIWAATGTALRARGWTAGQFLGRKVPEVGRPDDAAITEASCRAALRGEVSRFETTGNLDPSRLWAMQFLPLPAERGAVVGGMVLARDITRQRRAERQLEASRHQLAEAQRIAQIGSWEWDVVANEVTVSDELCRLIGLPLGSRWTMEEGVARLIPKMEIEQVERLVERMRTDPSPYAHEHRMVASDGSIRTYLARGEGMVDEDGRVVRFIGTDQDITERRQADAERRRLLHRVYEAQEGQDRRLAADLHDGHVQSLAAIGFKLEQARLRLGASASPEVDELLWQVTKDLSAEVTSLRRTIGRLRPLVLVEDGLEAALREEAKSACNRAALAACDVTSELDGRLDPVVETALFRVAQQALANVVDHAGATYALVAIECTGNGVVLRVSDDGRGFDPDHVQVLGDIAHFGLIAMRERVEALGGRFRVTTEPGGGTVVEARLPLTDPTEGWGT